MHEDPFTEKYFDVLQNIEFAIVQIYKGHSELSDWNVENMLDALIRAYRAEADNRTPSPARLSDLEQDLYNAVKVMCNWRLGRETPTDLPVMQEDTTPKTVDEIVLCLKRIKRSVGLWSKQGGRQGYLNFVSQYIE